MHTWVVGEYWSGTKVKYSCEDDHNLMWMDPEVLTCGEDGTWDYEAAPRCLPSKNLFNIYHLNFFRVTKKQTFSDISK